MKSATENRKPYSGLTRSLVIAIDVGTTFSGVSYAILEPGEIPKIHGVTRFPGQEHVAGNSKIPSVIYYDKLGRIMAAGAEADSSSVLAQAEDEGWIKTDLFKLRLRPRTMQLNMNGMRLGPLPRKKTAVHVFGDFLAYLYRCTRDFITDTHGNGAQLWNAVEHNIQFVLSHPNGWEGPQQSKMRRSAVYGGLIPDTNEGKARIRFVTEGEASLHACVLNGLAADVLSNPSKHGFLIADAGGGTLDISAYAIRGTAPLVMEEIAPPDCIFAGSVFVSRRAREFLEEKLRDSKYGTPAALDHITQRFDETTKRLFRDRKDLQFIPFGSPLDKDLAVGIRGGQLKLTGNEVANLFEPSVDAALNAIKKQIEASNGVIRSVFLVGGYAASPWLFSQLQERLAPFNVTVSRPDSQTSKAVADGAVGFYCDHHVSARMSKFMYGVEFLRELDPSNPDHVARKERLCELPSGPKLLPDAFDCILNRSIKVKESTVFTRKYCTELTSLSMLSVFEVEIWCYRGGNVIPKWIDRQADDFSTLCVVRADLSPLSGSAEPKAGTNGKTYWTIVFSVEIHFGLTEFKARIKWVDDGKTKYGPASIIYNERGHRAEEEEPDAYPEDDINNASPRNDRFRSEPASRARTPIEPFYHPAGSEIRGFDPPAAQPPIDVASIHRSPSSSKGHLSPSHTVAADLSRDLLASAETEKLSEPAALRERTPPLAPSPLASSSLVAPPDLSRSLEPEAVAETTSPRDKKGKGKNRIPMATPKIETPVVEPTSLAKTPVVSSPPILESTSTSATSTRTPVATPKVEESVIPAVESTPTPKTPQVTEIQSSSLWTTDPVTVSDPASTNLWGSVSPAKDKPEGTSKAEEAPIAIESKRSSFSWGSTAPSAKGKAAELPKGPAESKTSPVIGAGTSPLTASEPVVMAEVVTPAVSTTSSPALTSKAAKKAKKKGTSATTTPAARSIEPSPVQATDPQPSPAVEGATAPEATGETKDEPAPSSTVEEPAANIEKPSSNRLTPIGLPEVTLSTKTPEPIPLAIADEVQDSTSSLFSSNAWASSTSDTWGTFDKPKTPKSRPKTPVAGTAKADETSSTTPAAATPETKSLSGWGAVAKTPSADSSKSAGLGWGASATKKSGWGTSGATTPISTTPAWGSSFGSAAKSPSIKSAWGSKLNTPTATKAPSSPWGAKPSTPVEKEKEESKEEPKEESKEELKEEPKEESQETVSMAAPADTAKSETPTAQATTPDDKLPIPEPSGTDLQAEASSAVETGTAKVPSPKPNESDLNADAPQPVEDKQPTPQPSPKPVETPLDSTADATAEPETPSDPVTPGAEENEDKEEDKEEEKQKPGGGGGGGTKKGGTKKKKKKK
ncbi:Heat shock 70 kDa protein 12A [Termitomyces sp. J132]|nr:Heat shock 70 kDa protein 12A [Termitomyces sp. J132]